MRTILIFNDQEIKDDPLPYLRREVIRMNRPVLYDTCSVPPPYTNARIVSKWGGGSLFNVVRDIDGQLARDLEPSYDMSNDWKEYHESP